MKSSNDFIGRIVIGQYSSGSPESNHWRRMLSSHRTAVEQWHSLRSRAECDRVSPASLEVTWEPQKRWCHHTYSHGIGVNYFSCFWLMAAFSLCASVNIHDANHVFSVGLIGFVQAMSHDMLIIVITVMALHAHHSIHCRKHRPGSASEF